MHAHGCARPPPRWSPGQSCGLGLRCVQGLLQGLFWCWRQVRLLFCSCWVGRACSLWWSVLVVVEWALRVCATDQPRRVRCGVRRPGGRCVA